MIDLRQGDCLEVMRTLPDESVNCIVTSPPYWGLRDYGHAGQLGLEPTFAEYLSKLVAIFEECRRVLRKDGTCWVNMGSSFSSGDKRPTPSRQPSHVLPYDNDGKELEDSQGLDCVCPDRDDELPVASPIHRDGIADNDPHRQRVSQLDGLTTRDIEREDQVSVHASPHDVQGSNIPSSSLNAPVASCPEDDPSELPTGEHSSTCCDPRFSHTAPSICGKLTTELPSENRIEDMAPLDLAYLYCTIASRGYKAKDLVNQGAILAEALRISGWILRSDIIWHKPNPMPESVQDRPTRAHEYVFLFVKSQKYRYDADAIREPLKDSSIARLGQHVDSQEGSHRANGGAKTNGTMKAVCFGGTKGCDDNPTYSGKEWLNDGQGANARTVWTIATQGYPDAHFATFPEELPKRCILAGCPEGGTVLDIFAGSGTTLAVAIRLGRQAIGIELSPEYVELARQRINAETPSLFAGIND